MKYIFLDIKGVLNPYKFDKERDEINVENIDGSRLDLLKEIVKKTGAKRILISEWSKHWEKSEIFCDKIGKELNEIFKKHGIEICDKTPYMSDNGISAYLSDNRLTDLEAFCIIDENMHVWDSPSPFLAVSTQKSCNGLEKRHVEMIIESLNRKGQDF